MGPGWGGRSSSKMKNELFGHVSMLDDVRGATAAITILRDGRPRSAAAPALVSRFYLQRTGPGRGISPPTSTASSAIPRCARCSAGGKRADSPGPTDGGADLRDDVRRQSQPEFPRHARRACRISLAVCCSCSAGGTQLATPMKPAKQKNIGRTSTRAACCASIRIRSASRGPADIPSVRGNVDRGLCSCLSTIDPTWQRRFCSAS